MLEYGRTVLDLSTRIGLGLTNPISEPGWGRARP